LTPAPWPKLTLPFGERVDIDIPDEEAGKVRTVPDALVFVEKYRRAERRG
jgi:acyl carrier protein